MGACTVVALAALGAGSAWAAGATSGVAGNQIAPDGRTLTQVSTSGSTTTVTTRTLSGGNAFNSFNDFTVGAGNTVNLKVPGSANNLINLVHASPVEINGVLNSYKNGKIGGNIYFADPYGMVVGKSGVVNVGSLAVSTPTAAFLDSVVGPDGVVNATAASKLLSGNIPLSPDGVVTIDGKVNAQDAVRLLATRASVSGSVSVTQAATAQKLLFSKSVNADGLQSGTALVSKGGVIEIVVQGDATINGTVTADGSAKQAAGVVQAEAGADLSVGRNAVVSASGTSGDENGGHVRVYAAHNLTVVPGAQLLAKASGTGSGGTIEASAGHTAVIGGGLFDASSPAGTAGSVLFDPTDLYIGAAANAPSGDAVSASVYSPGTDVSLTADNSITVAAGYEVNTRQVATGANADTAASTGNSGNITLTAPNITIEGAVPATSTTAAIPAAELRADAINTNGTTYTAGIVKLTATDNETGSGLAGITTATTGITIDGTIKAGAILADASSSATSSYTNPTGTPSTSVLGSSANKVITKAFTTFTTLTGVDFSFAVADATAGVTVGNGASLDASGGLTSGATVAAGTINLDASTAESASIDASAGANTSSPIQLGAAFGEVAGTPTVDVQSGATITATGPLTVRAYNNGSLSTSASTVSGSASQNFPLTLAFSYADINSSATIDSGAAIQAADVSVIAHNDNSFATKASSSASSNGVAGVAAAIADLNTQATANEYADLGTSADPIGNLTVEADSVNVTNTVNASTKVSGSPPASTTSTSQSSAPLSSLQGSTNPVNSVSPATSSGSGTSTSGSTSSGSSFQVGSALALALSTQGATADIGTDPNVAGATAPQIYASGAVTVNSLVDDEGIRNDATSATSSPSAQGGSAGSTVNVSAGVAIGEYTHNTLSTIGDGVNIHAANIGVGAETYVPATITWTRFLDGKTLLNKIEQFFKDNANKTFGLPAEVFTSYANATNSGGSSVDLNGTVNFFQVTDNTKAWVGSATLIQTSSNTGSWSTTLDTNGDTVDAGTTTSDNTVTPTSVSWAEPLSVAAVNNIASIDVAGDFSLFPPFTGTSGSSQTDAVGGAFNYINYVSNTIAGIDAGAVVTAQGLSVTADSRDSVIGISPTSGKGSSISGSGIIALTSIDNTTHASISNTADITAPVVAVKTSDGLSLWSIAGALESGSNAGVGVAVAVNLITTDTQAFVGDNSGDDPLDNATSDSSDAVNPANGFIKTGDLEVNANTDGMAGALSVAGSRAKSSSTSTSSSSSSSGSSSSPGFLTKAKSTFTTLSSGLQGLASGKLSSLTTLNKLFNSAKTDNTTAANNQTNAQTTGNQDPSASNSETSTPSTPSGGGSSGPSLSSTSSSTQSANYGIGISGSATLNDSNRTTKAYLEDATVSDPNGAATVNVQALDFTGLVSASGAGALVQAGNDSSFSAGIAGVVSLAIGNDTVEAYIDNSTVSNADTVDVEALRGGFDVAVGLGLSVNTTSTDSSAAAAVSASLAFLTDLTDARITNSTVTGQSGDTGRSATVEAYNNDGILIGGGALYGGGAYGIGMAVTYDQIVDPTVNGTTVASTQASIQNSTVKHYDTVTVLGDSAQEIGSGAGSGGVSTTAESLGLAGAFDFNVIGTTTDAQVSGSTVDATGQVAVNATGADDPTLDTVLDNRLGTESLSTFESGFDFLGTALNGASGVTTGTQPGASVIALAAVVQIQTNGENAGIANVDNVVANTYQSSIADSTVTAGSVNDAATDDTYILAIGFGVGGAGGEFSGVGSVTANIVTDQATATLGDPSAASQTTHISANTVDVSASNAATIWSLAGGVSVAPSGTAVGAAIAYNEIGTPGGSSTPTTGAVVDNAAITLTSGSATPALDVTTSETGSIRTLSVAGAIGGEVAVAGSLSLNIMGDTSAATLDNSSVVTDPATTLPLAGTSNSACSASAPCSIDVSASNGSSIYALAGNVSGGDETAVGVSFAVNVITDKTTAEASNASWVVPNGVNFNAGSTATIYSLAIGGGGSGSIAVFGSNTDNAIANQTTASLTGITQGDSPWLNVSATDNSQISSLAGSISGAGEASVGLAIAVNVITDGAHATISDSTLDVPGSLTDQSGEISTIKSMAVAGGGAGEAAIGGSVTTNVIANTVEAGMTDVGLGNGQGDDNANVTTITASDTPTIESLAGSVQVGGEAGVGIALAVNVIADTTHAYMYGTSGGTAGPAYDAGDVLVNALSDATIQTISVGAAASGAVAAAGSVSVNVLSDGVTAEIGQGAQVNAYDNVGVEAANTDKIDTFAGDLAVSPTVAGVGIGVTTNTLSGNTTADISGAATRVTALGNGAPLTVADGTLVSAPDVTAISAVTSGFTPPNLTENTKSASGVAVNAESLRALTDLNVGLAVALDPEGSAAVNVQAGVNVLGGKTLAYIDQAAVTAGTGAPPSGAGPVSASLVPGVDVTASGHDFAANFVVGAAASSNVAVQGTIGVNVFDSTNQAYIDGSTVDSQGDVGVYAVSSQDSAALVGGVSAALVGVGGTGVVNVFEADTESSIDGGSVTAADVTVKADSESSLQMIGGAASIGGAALAGTVLVGVSNDTTKAYIGDTGQVTTLTVPGAVTVKADNTSNLTTLAVSVGAGFPAYAGMIAVNSDSATTDANIYNVKLDWGGTAANSVDTAATSTLNVNAYSGSVAAGVVFGAGLSVNVVYVMPVTNAGISGSDINATTIQVTATGNKNIDAYTLTGSTGIEGAVSGAIGVIIVDEPTSGASNGQLSGAGSLYSSKLGYANTLAGRNSSSTADTTVQNSTIISENAPNASSDLNATTAGTATSVGEGGQGNGTAATIAGGTIDANGVTVTATDNTSTTNVAGAGAIGGLFGASAGIAVTSVNGTVSAEITSGTQLNVSNGVTVTATAQDGSAGHAIEVDAYAGGGGIGPAVSAGVAVGVINNTVTAQLDGTLGSSSLNTGSDSAAATDGSTIETNADGGAIGGVGAVGIMVSYASKTSNVTASASPSATDYVTGLSLQAQDSGTVDAAGVAASGGIGFGGSGVGATASDASTVNAFIGGGSTIDVTGGEVLVQALSVPETSASTTGVSVAGGVSIGASVATAGATPTVTAYVGNGASINGSGSLSVLAGSEPVGYGPKNTSGTVPVASANAIAGSGSLLYSGNAAAATATDNAQVNAYTGTGVALPDGDVTIGATNASTQNANAVGVTVGGILALGGAVATAEAGNSSQPMLTSAELGDNAYGTAGRNGALTVFATGTDLDQASATAGSGGLGAADAAVSTTKDYADVSATVGSNLGSSSQPFVAGTVTVTAFHGTGYGAGANSINAAVVGASGSSANNSANVNVTTNIGDIGSNSTGNVYLLSLGPVAITAQDVYVEDMPSGFSYGAQGAAGGVFSGAAALSSTTLTGAATVNLGKYDKITAGSASSGVSADITIVASNMVTSNDQADLETGGAIAGAGVNDNLTVNMTNTVNIDAYDYLSSFGNIGAGTYAMINALVNAYVSTWGGVAVGSSSATANVTSNESVNVHRNVTIDAAGNVDLTPGQYPNPFGLYNTLLDINSVAQGYVRGLIAVPLASATGNATANDTLDIHTGDNIQSGQDTIVGAYPGTPTITVDGTGHGYELGFIPVTTHHNTANPVTTSTVTVNGTILAGVYNTLTIDIANCQSDGFFCDTFTQASGLPMGSPSFYYDASYNPHSVIDLYQTGSQKQALDSNTASGTVGAFKFASLYASGGSVTINAGSLSGSGSVTAQGGPSITVNNYSPDFIEIGSASIPTTGGGEIFFTGAAGKAQAGGIQLNSQGAGAEPAIVVHEAYGGSLGGALGGYGPAVFVTGKIDNVNGSVTIINDQGSIGQFGTVKALQFVEQAPNGVITIGTPYTPIEFLGGSPDAEWFNYMIWPGGNPDAGQQPNANWAIAYVANATTSGGGSDQGALNANLIGNVNYDNNYTSTIFYQSNCLPANSGSCDNNYNYAADNSPGNFGVTLDPGNDGNVFWFPGVPVVATSASTNALLPTSQQYSLPNANGVVPGITAAGGSQSSTIQGREVLVQAQVIDVSGSVSGTNTDWSVNLPASLTAPLQTACIFGFCFPISGGQLAFDQWKYDNYHGQSQFAISGLTAVHAGDSLISATYDAQTQSITVDKVNAAATGGFISMVGGIISTNPLGAVHLNSGLGHVTIDNSTGDAVTLQEINAGALTNSKSITSTVEIEDYFKDYATSWYVFTPGAAAGTGSIAEYLTYYGAPYTSADYTGTINGTGTAYAPVSGMRWNWSYSASLYRNVTINYSSNPVSNWAWSNNSNDPWTESAGYVTWGNSDSAPVFQESITGGYSGGGSGAIAYHGCDDGTCNYGFLQTVGKGASPNCPCAYWTYYFPGNAYLNLYLSVKADNPIAVSFGGNTTGLIDVNSNAPVTINGPLNNPDGSTSLTADGNIAETPLNGSILSNDLTLIANGGSVGTVAQPMNATLTAGGVLTVEAGGEGVNLNLGGGANVNEVNANDGAVLINANGDLNPETAGQSFIGGRTISIDDTGGGVGESGQLVLRPLQDGSAGSGVVDITALGDINIQSQGGDLLIGTQGIVSSTGNVTIDVPGGAILDASDETAGEALSNKQLQTIWNDLHLIGAGAQTNATALYERQVSSDYQQYWMLLGNGSVSNGTFMLNAGSIANFKFLAAASLNVDPAVVTDAQVQGYANGLYQNLTNTFAQTFGSSWASQSPFAAYQPTFQYQATAAQAAAQGAAATWTLAQLQDAVDVAALGTGTPVGVGNPNVSGRDVSLTSGGSLGELLPPLQINVTDLINGTLTAQQAAALAVATTPGSVDQSHVITELQNGVEIATGGYILVNQTAPLFVAAAGTFNGASNGTIYLQSTAQNLTLGKVSALGNVNLVAPGSILSASGTPLNILTPGDVTLQAGSGTIGTSGAPLLLSIGGRLLSAVAGEGVYAAEVPSVSYVITNTQFCIFGFCFRVPAFQPVSQNADLTVTQIYSPNGTVQLTSTRGSILADPNPPASFVADGLSNITAENVALNAAGDIGSISGGEPLTVDLGTSGKGVLNGTAGGSAYVYSPSDALAVGTFQAGGNLDLTTALNYALMVQNLVSAAGNIDAASGGSEGVANASAPSGNVTLTAFGPLTTDAAGNIAAAGKILASAASIDMGAGSTLSAAGPVDLATSSGDMTLGEVTSNLSNGTAFTVNSAGGIFGNGDGNPNLVMTGDNALTQLTSAGEVGTTSLPFAINGEGSGDELTGTIGGAGYIAIDPPSVFYLGNVTAANDLDMTANAPLALLAGDTVQSTGGNLNLVATAFTMGPDSLVKAARAVSLTTTGGDMVIGEVVSGGSSITLTAAGSIYGNGDGNPNVVLEGNNATADIVTTSGGEVGTGSVPSTFAAPIETGYLPLVIDEQGAGELVNGNVSGAAYLTSVNPFNVGNFTSGGDLAITTAGDLNANSLTSTNGSVDASIGGSGNINSTTGGKNVVLIAVKDLTLNSVTSGADMGLIAGGKLTFQSLSVGGNIMLGNASSRGSMLIQAGGEITFQNLSSVKDLTLVSKHDDVLQVPNSAVNAGGNASFSGVGIIMDNVNVTGTTTLAATGPIGTLDNDTTDPFDPVGYIEPSAGDIDVASLQSGGAVTANAAGSITIPVLISTTGSVDMTAGITPASPTENITITTLSAGQNITSDASGATNLGTGSAGGFMSLTSGGNIAYDTLASDGDMTLAAFAGNIEGTTANAGGNASFTAGEAVALNTLTAQGSAQLDAQGGDVTVADYVSAGNDVSIDALGSILAQNTGRAVPTVNSTNGSVDMNAGQDIDITTLNAGQNITSNAVGTTNVPTGTAGGFMNMTSGGAITYDTLASGGDMTLTSLAGDVLGTAANAGGNATMSAVGIAFQTLKAGGATLLTAYGPLSADDAVAGNVVIGEYIQGVGDVTVNAVPGSITGPLVVAKSGSITLTAGTLAANGMVPFTPGENIIITTLNAGQNIASNAGGTTNIETGASGGATEISSGGPVTFVALTAGGGMSVTSETADVLGVTANAGGNASFTGLGVSLLTSSAGGSTTFDAYGPISASDPYAGEIIVDSAQAGGDVNGTAAGSIFVPTITSNNGSINLAAGQDIEVPVLSAGGDIATAATAGVTNVNTAAAGGSLDMSSGGTIAFHSLTAGHDMSVVSKTGYVLGLVDGDGENQSESWVSGTEGSEPGSALFDDGSATAGGNMNLAGVGVSAANLTAGGSLSIAAYGVVPPATAMLGANEPNLADAIAQLGGVQTDLAATPADTADALTGLNAALVDLAHGTPVATATVAPTYFGDLAQSLSDVATALGGNRQLTLGDDQPGNGTLPTTEFVPEADGYGTFNYGGIYFDTLASSGDTALTSGTVIDGEQLSSTGAMTLKAGTILTPATAPLPQNAALGSILVDGIDGAGGVTGSAYGSILTDFVTSANGSIGLNAGLDIKVPTLTAGEDITTVSGGLTNVDTATAGGSISMTAGGPVTFVTLTADKDIAATSLTGDVLGVTASAGGNAAFDGMGVSMLSSTAGADTTLTAYGPLAQTDPYAGEIIIDNVTSGGSVTGTAFGTLFIPTLTATGGSVTLTAGQDIEIPTLTAGADVATQAAGVTNFATVTAGGVVNLASGNTITFHTLLAGGNVAAVSLNGYVLGLPDRDAERAAEHGDGEGDGERGRKAGDSLLDDGSIASGGNITLAGVGVHFANATAAGNVVVTAYGTDPNEEPADDRGDGPRAADQDEESYAAEQAGWAAGTPDLDDGGPRMVDALFALTELQHDLGQTAPSTTDTLGDLNDALRGLTHFGYTLTAAPKYMSNLVTTLHNVAAGFLPATAEEMTERVAVHPEQAEQWQEAFAAHEAGDFDFEREHGPAHDYEDFGDYDRGYGIVEGGWNEDAPEMRGDLGGQGQWLEDGVSFNDVTAGGNVTLALGTIPADPDHGTHPSDDRIDFEAITAGGNVGIIANGGVHGDAVRAGGDLTAAILGHDFHIGRIKAQQVALTFYGVGEDHDARATDDASSSRESARGSDHGTHDTDPQPAQGHGHGR